MDAGLDLANRRMQPVRCVLLQRKCLDVPLPMLIEIVSNPRGLDLAASAVPCPLPNLGHCLKLRSRCCRPPIGGLLNPCCGSVAPSGRSCNIMQHPKPILAEMSQEP